MALVVVDVVGGPVVAVLTVIAVLLLPDFLPLHRTSLLGPPLLTTTVAMLAVMLAAPRFSLAYGAVAAVGAVWVSPAGTGLVLAAVGWALWQPRNGRGGAQRAWLAVLPTAVAMPVGMLVGTAWATPVRFGWRGGLDHVLTAMGGELGAQLVPAIPSGALRWFMVADTTLILLALVAVGWQQAAATASPERPRRFYPAAALLIGSLVAGLLARSMLIVGTPLPDTEDVFPLAVLATLVVAISASVLWPRWRWWGKGIALVLLLGWIGAAVMG